MNKIAGLLTTTLLAVGLMCAPASAQGDEDDDKLSGGALAVLLLYGASTKSSPWQKGNFRADRGTANREAIGSRAAFANRPARIRTVDPFIAGGRLTPVSRFPGNTGLGRGGPRMHVQPSAMPRLGRIR